MLVGSCSSAQISTDPGLVLLFCGTRGLDLIRFAADTIYKVVYKVHKNHFIL